MLQNDGTRTPAFVLAAALMLAACGGDNAAETSPRVPASSPPEPPASGIKPGKDYSDYYPPGTHQASRAAVAVITKWSDELRAGHVARAASYFDVPAIVQNATPPIRLMSRKEVLAFNRTLPCGAHVVKTIAGSRYTVATFVLTERPGSPGCGATGKLAAAAFRLRHGKIAEWRRVLVPPPLGPPQNLKQPQLQS